MIKPTVGRVVLFRTREMFEDNEQPMAALVAYVHNDACINIAYFTPEGRHQSATSVYLHQEAGPVPALHGSWCEWMPYQKGQAAKTEALEAKGAKSTQETVASAVAYENALIAISRATDAGGRAIILLPYRALQQMPQPADFRKAIVALTESIGEKTVFIDGFGVAPDDGRHAEAVFAGNLELLVRGWRACLAHLEAIR